MMLQNRYLAKTKWAICPAINRVRVDVRAFLVQNEGL